MSLKKITAEDFYKKLKKEKVLLLDVRAEEKYNEYHIEDSNVDSLNINKMEIFKLEDAPSKELTLPKNREIVVTCTTGNSATKCASILSNLDYDVVVLEGGITAWKEYEGK
ncbi:hypothetical protein GCM10008967_30630 [Bacillus carboniphilus]|uniref:Rhodanese domain-containing protein n=1 Tax=Bacillus carboniphilus TaxID=86663 RepID=A0ABN0WI04_9BACI